MENYNELKELVLGIENDVIKFFEKNNKSAGVRVRKTLQEVKRKAQDLRVDISNKNKEQ